MIIFGSSNIGMVRKDNQDSYLFDTVGNNVGLRLFCDGMGGPSGGKIASSVAVNSFSKFMTELSYDSNGEKIKETFQKAIDCANKEIYNKSLGDDKLYGMGTTLVSSVIVNDTGYFVNVGDSRAYLIRDDSIRRISHDHSAVQQLVDNGMLQSTARQSSQ